MNGYLTIITLLALVIVSLVFGIAYLLDEIQTRDYRILGLRRVLDSKFVDDRV